MKYPTLQKIGLTTIALLASLALNAQAGKPTMTSGNNSKHSTSMSARGITAPAKPAFPAVILYDQYDNASGVATLSATFTDFVDFGADLADDFVVPAGQNWTIESIDADGVYFNGSGPATSWNVFLYTDAGGLPGGIVASQMNLPATQVGTTFTVNFAPSVALTAGTYWIEIQANMTFGTEGEWGWTDRTVQSNSAAAWQNPGGGFLVCPTWAPKLATCVTTAGGPDQVYRINGTNGGTPTPTPTPTATPAGALWYNGDFDGVDGLTNEQDTFLTGFSHIYDDFNVPDANGWDVTSVFSDNLANTNITSATWEIRQGVSSGVGGTIVASGMTVTPVITPTGRSGFGFTEFMVEVPGLNVHLDGNGAIYWLNVTPVDSLDGGRSFDSTTSGANCIGTPCGNNDNAFLDSTLFGAVFEPVADFGSQFHDFSMGVNGTVSGGGGEITLTAKVRRVHGDRRVALSWTPADGGEINILRDGVVIRTTADDGRASDRLGSGPREAHEYQVCETDTGTCSNVVRVKVPGSGQ